MKIIEHFVEGKKYSGNSKKTSLIDNPATGESTAKVKLGSVEDLNKAVEVAQKALKIKVSKLEEEVKELKEIDRKVQEDVNSVKVSIAEKMGYGVAGGGIATVLTKILESLGG